MAILHNRFQTLDEATKYLERERFEIVMDGVNRMAWISHDGLINAKIIGNAVTYRYSIEYTA